MSDQLFAVEPHARPDRVAQVTVTRHPLYLPGSAVPTPWLSTATKEIP